MSSFSTLLCASSILAILLLSCSTEAISLRAAHAAIKQARQKGPSSKEADPHNLHWATMDEKERTHFFKHLQTIGSVGGRAIMSRQGGNVHLVDANGVPMANIIAG